EERLIAHPREPSTAPPKLAGFRRAERCSLRLSDRARCDEWSDGHVYGRTLAPSAAAPFRPTRSIILLLSLAKRDFNGHTDPLQPRRLLCSLVDPTKNVILLANRK